MHNNKEQELLQRETMLRRTQAIAHLGTWEYDPSTGSLHWSDETYRLFGKDPAGFIPTYERFLEIIYPEDRPAVSSSFQESIDKGHDRYEIKHRITHGITGDIRWVHERCFHQRNRNGDLIRSFGMVQDVTDREHLMRKYEQFYQAIQYSMNAVIFTNIDGSITHINPSFENMYGYSREEARGENPRILNPGRDVYYDFGYTDEEYNAIFSTMWKNVSDPGIGVWDGEILNRTKLGEILRIHLYINAVRDGDGNIVSYVGMPVDVSTERKREQEIRIHTYMAIADLAEQRDNETGQHMKRIGEYSYFIARELELPKKFCDDIKIFSQFHDIGKVGISDNILLVPRKLSAEEYEIIKTHPVIGYNILHGRPTLEMAAEIAHGHQEKFDGTGYPRQLSGHNIPLSARITALADVYDALRSERPYKEAFSEEKSFSIIMEGENSHFDPDLIAVFSRCRRDFDRIYRTWSD